MTREYETKSAGLYSTPDPAPLPFPSQSEQVAAITTHGAAPMPAPLSAVSDAYTDPSDSTGKPAVVDIVPETKLPRPITLAEIKADRAFADFPLTRIPRLSVMPVTDREWRAILKRAGTKPWNFRPETVRPSFKAV